MSEEAVRHFEETLGARVKTQLEDLYDDEFTTDATVISTRSVGSGGRSRNLQAKHRSLQQAALDIVTELNVQTRSATKFTSNVITEDALKAFDTNVELQDFLSELRLNDSSFTLVSSVDNKVGGGIESLRSREKESGLSSWGIVGISLGSATVLLTSLLVAASCRKRNRGQDQHDPEPDDIDSRLGAYMASER